MDTLENVQLVVREIHSEAQKDASKRMWSTLRQGRMPAITTMAEARGLVVRARDHSIFSDAWVPLAFIFLITGFAVGRNIAALALGGALLLTVWVSQWWKDNSLTNVTYERSFDRTHVFPNEPIQMKIRVKNQKWLPLTWLQFGDELPIVPEGASVLSQIQGETTGRYVLQNSFSIAGHEQKQRDYTLIFKTRGFKRLGPVRYQSGDIFTLFTTERVLEDIQTLVVYPRIWTMEALRLPAKEPFGPISIQKSLFTDPIKTQGIRDYHPQDRFRDIHWKASARRGNLQTKVYEPSTGMHLALFLNVATMPRHWMGHLPEQLEWVISLAGSIASYGVEQKWAVGLYANGSVPKSDQPIRVPAGRDPNQLLYVLEALAAVTEFATGSIETLMLRESPRLPWSATMVLVTAVLTEEMVIALWRLKDAGRRLALFYTGEERPSWDFEGITFYHLPEKTDEQPAMGHS